MCPMEVWRVIVLKWGIPSPRIRTFSKSCVVLLDILESKTHKFLESSMTTPWKTQPFHEHLFFVCIKTSWPITKTNKHIISKSPLDSLCSWLFALLLLAHQGPARPWPKGCWNSGWNRRKSTKNNGWMIPLLVYARLCDINNGDSLFTKGKNQRCTLCTIVQINVSLKCFQHNWHILAPCHARREGISAAKPSWIAVAQLPAESEPPSRKVATSQEYGPGFQVTNMWPLEFAKQLLWHLMHLANPWISWDGLHCKLFLETRRTRPPASMQCNWVAASEFAKVCFWSHFETPVTWQVWKPRHYAGFLMDGTLSCNPDMGFPLTWREHHPNHTFWGDQPHMYGHMYWYSRMYTRSNNLSFSF